MLELYRRWAAIAERTVALCKSLKVVYRRLTKAGRWSAALCSRLEGTCSVRTIAVCWRFRKVDRMPPMGKQRC